MANAAAPVSLEALCDLLPVSVRRDELAVQHVRSGAGGARRGRGGCGRRG
jgi:hypothetical protein